MTSLRCPECGTPRHDPPDAKALPFGTVVYLTCSWCGERYGARVLHRRDVRDDVPPGMLALAQLNGGGTATVAGNLRGNVAIHSQAQAAAARRQHGAHAVNRHADLSRVNVDVNASEETTRRLQRHARQRNGGGRR